MVPVVIFPGKGLVSVLRALQVAASQLELLRAGGVDVAVVAIKIGRSLEGFETKQCCLAVGVLAKRSSFIVLADAY